MQFVIRLTVLVLVVVCTACDDSSTSTDMSDTGTDMPTMDLDVANDTGDGTDGETTPDVDMGIVTPTLVPTTFATTAKVGFGGPERTSPTDPILDGDVIARMKSSVGSPPRWLKTRFESQNALFAFAGPAADTALVGAAIQALNAHTPISSVRRGAASDDFDAFVGDSRFYGELEIASAPDENGLLTTEQRYEFTEVGFIWTLPCIDSGMAGCEERHRLALADLGIVATQLFGATLTGDNLEFSPSILRFSHLALVQAFVTRFVLPGLLNTTDPVSERVLAEVMMDALVESYNATPAGQMNPASTTPDYCAGVAFAWARLAVELDGTLDLMTLEMALERGCEDALADTIVHEGFIAQHAQEHYFSVANFDGCNFRDTTMDGVFDEFGEVWEPDAGIPIAPTESCILALEFRTLDDALLEYLWEFKGSAP